MILLNMTSIESQLSIFRTLIEVVGIDVEKGMVNLVVPGWNPDITVTIAAARIQPPELLDYARAGGMLLARVNLAAERPENLTIQDFERITVPGDKGKQG